MQKNNLRAGVWKQPVSVIHRVVQMMLMLILLSVVFISFSVFVDAAKVYRVGSGQSLYLISRWYGVDMNRIAYTNNLESPERIFSGQILIIPDPQLKAGDRLYTVKQGDTLYQISTRYGVSVNEISEYNNIDGGMIYVGQRLRIPGEAPPPTGSGGGGGGSTGSGSSGSGSSGSGSGYVYNIPDLMKKFPGKLVLSGPSNEKKVALTFDDGPDALYTPMVLDLLAKYGVKATFFVRGDRAAENPWVVQRMIREGHTVGSHSWSHPNLRVQSRDKVNSEIDRTHDTVRDWTNLDMTLFRPPYGELSEEALSSLIGRGYTAVNWSVDSGDWRVKDVNQVFINTLPAVRKGSIILMHSAGGVGQDMTNTVNALPDLIYTLSVQGYKFVTVNELLSVPAYR